MSEYQEPTQADFLYAHIESLKEENARLRAENDKLRGQVEGLKGCLGFAVFAVAWPDMPYLVQRSLGKKLMEDMDADNIVTLWWKQFTEERCSSSLLLSQMQFMKNCNKEA